VALSWLEVTTDEVQSKLGANERLAERRATIEKQVRETLESLVAPAFRKAAEADGWEYFEQAHTEWSVVRCGIHGPGDVERDPTVAFRIAEFDAYQPLVILRRKPEGAAAQASSEIVKLDKLDAETLQRFLADS
tara:strand:- start:817 stop:1218 length:402 start_codon:yes stop_codon:yes gene_type:complete